MRDKRDALKNQLSVPPIGFAIQQFREAHL
jgi:hypothetical protein